MKRVKLFVFLLLGIALILPVAFNRSVKGQSVVDTFNAPGGTFTITGTEGNPTFVISVTGQNDTEAPQGFDNLSNGLVSDDVHTNTDRANFEEFDKISNGLGPVYNADACSECHQSPVTGSVSQVAELRAGHNSGGVFVNPTVTIEGDNGQPVSIPNRSLINNRTICPGVDATQLGSNGTPFNHPNANAQEVVPDTENIRTFRATTNTLGDGFVEVVDSNVLAQIAVVQNIISGGLIQGEFIQVPVNEANNQVRGGRFGWKNQQASLLSFSGDAYLNEMGITNRFNPTEVTGVCDTVNDPEDTPSATPDPVTGTNLADIDRFARFMRATKAPSRDTLHQNDANVLQGQAVFNAIGCAICHVPQLVTANTGTSVNGGQFVIPSALGNKTFHPFSDFLLHNVGTGDGIVQDGPQDTANKVRTAPLWGLRTHGRFMHDLESLTLTDAILRHAGEAASVTENFENLSSSNRAALIAYLKTL